MRYTYYPGCSLHATGVGYDKSMRAVFNRLGVEIEELDDWNCCGATAYTAINRTVSYTLSARNLTLAAAQGNDVVAPCSACYYALNRTSRALDEQPELRDHVEDSLAEVGLALDASTPVRHPLEILINDIGIPTLAATQTRSLEGLRPACYYGCQIVRPISALDDDPESPMVMEGLLRQLGADPVDYPPKVRCCGGMMVATSPEVAAELSGELVGWARERDANCIVTVCPLCQANLDLLNIGPKQDRIPIVYFTQLVGLALGCSAEEVGLQHGLARLAIDELPVGAGRS